MVLSDIYEYVRNCMSDIFFNFLRKIDDISSNIPLTTLDNEYFFYTKKIDPMKYNLLYLFFYRPKKKR